MEEHIITNKNLSPEDCINNIFGIESDIKNGNVDMDKKCLGALVSVIYDDSYNLRVRLAAITGVALLGTVNKRDVFPFFLNFLNYESNKPEAQEISRQAVENIYLLNDSRALFLLAKKYFELSQEKEHDRLLGHSIIEAIGNLADPRAENFFESLHTGAPQMTATLAARALEKCRNNTNFLYTFHGNEDYRKAVAEQPQPTDSYMVVAGASDLQSQNLPEFVLQEERAGIGYAIYVVLPKSKNSPFSGECQLLIGPRRSEHYRLARGEDVLAAGEIGIKRDGTIAYVNNHSSSYFPGKTSFHWLSKALASAQVPHDKKQFDRVWPENYFEKNFLDQVVGDFHLLK